MLPLVPRILVCAHIPPRPAIESTFLNVRDVIRDEVIAESIPLIHRAPQLAGLRTHSDSSARIANAVRMYLELAVRGVAGENVGAILLPGVRVGIVDVRR